MQGMNSCRRSGVAEEKGAVAGPDETGAGVRIQPAVAVAAPVDSVATEAAERIRAAGASGGVDERSQSAGALGVERSHLAVAAATLAGAAVDERSHSVGASGTAGALGVERSHLAVAAATLAGAAVDERSHSSGASSTAWVLGAGERSHLAVAVAAATLAGAAVDERSHSAGASGVERSHFAGAAATLAGAAVDERCHLDVVPGAGERSHLAASVCAILVQIRPV